MSAPITIQGRLGTDIELRFAGNGTAIAKCRVVTDRRVKEGDEWKSVDVTWWSVTAFSRLAERIVERLAKGDPVVIIGRVKSREWETPEGEKRSAFEVVADSVCLDLARIKDDAPSKPSSGTSDPWASGSADAPF